MTKSATREAADKATFTQAEVTAKDTAARAGRKNLIINGAMQVAQRGTSQSANGYGSLDRWNGNTSNTVAITQTATTVAETDILSGIEYYSRLVGTSTDSGRQWFQKIEGLKKFSNETVTFSFYAKASASTTVSLQYGLLGAGSDTYSDFSTKEIGTSWDRYTATVTLPSMSSGFTFASGDNLRIAFQLKETNYTLDITGVQLELGSVATDFEHRSYGEELADCQRFYFISGKTNGKCISSFGFSRGGYLQYIYAPIPFPCEMRAIPTVASGGSISAITYSGGYATNTCTAVVQDISSTTQGVIRAEFSSGSWSSGDEAILQDSDGTGFISFDAEL